VLGAGLVLLGAYAPELLKASAERIEARQPDNAASTPEVRFEFDELLRNSEVVSTPEDYPATFEDEQPNQTTQYLLQAASFRDSEDADTLRAQLLLLSLPTRVDQVQLDNGRWYRVTVGPFSSQADAQRAMTRLRQHNLGAVLRKKRLDT